MATPFDEKIEFLDPGAVFFDGPGPRYEEAFIGVTEEDGLAVYDLELMIKALESRGMSRAEAEEYLDYNVIHPCADKWPVIIRRFE